jgi:hypothetical protein
MDWIEFCLNLSIVEITTVRSSIAEILLERIWHGFPLNMMLQSIIMPLYSYTGCKGWYPMKQVFINRGRLQNETKLTGFLRPPYAEALRHTKSYQCEYIPETISR